MQKIGQSRGFLGRFSLINIELLLMKSVLKPLAKSVSIPLELTAAALATDEAIHKKMFGSGNTTLISNEEMNDIIKIIKTLEESVLLIKDVKGTERRISWNVIRHFRY